MRIGITGGAGYIAAHIIQDLLERGHEVVVIDDLSTGNRANILEESSRYRFVEGDISNRDDLARFFEDPLEVIFHFAASKAAGESMILPEKYSSNNIRGTLTLLEELVAREVRYFIFSSSAAVYGSPQYLPIDEEHPLEPENYYGYTKKAIEDNLRWFSRLKDIRFAALRYFNASGYDMSGRVLGLENEPNNLLPIIMEVAVGIRPELQVFGNDYETPDGTCIRDYIHLNDLSLAHIQAMEYIIGENKDLVVNVGSESGLSVLEILEVAREVTGQQIPHRNVGRRAGDPGKLVASSQKIKELLGWEAQHSNARDIVDTTWKLYRQNFLADKTF